MFNEEEYKEDIKNLWNKLYGKDTDIKNLIYWKSVFNNIIDELNENEISKKNYNAAIENGYDKLVIDVEIINEMINNIKNKIIESLNIFNKIYESKGLNIEDVYETHILPHIVNINEINSIEKLNSIEEILKI